MRKAASRRCRRFATALRIGLPVGGGTDADRVMSYNPFVALLCWMLDGRTLSGLPTRAPSEIHARTGAAHLDEGSAWFTHEN